MAVRVQLLEEAEELLCEAGAGQGGGQTAGWGRGRTAAGTLVGGGGTLI